MRKRFLRSCCLHSILNTFLKNNVIGSFCQTLNMYLPRKVTNILTERYSVYTLDPNIRFLAFVTSSSKRRAAIRIRTSMKITSVALRTVLSFLRTGPFLILENALRSLNLFIHMVGLVVIYYLLA